MRKIMVRDLVIRATSRIFIIHKIALIRSFIYFCIKWRQYPIKILKVYRPDYCKITVFLLFVLSLQTNINKTAFNWINWDH